jgi:hypothetical protein
MLGSPPPLYYLRRLPGRVEWGRLAPELSTAGDFDLTLLEAWTFQSNSPGCGRNGSRGRVQVCKTVCKTEATVLSLLLG